jgi:hypothetical protein
MSDEGMVLEARPVILLRPSDLWRWRKDPLLWLREERQALEKLCEAAARRAAALRVPEPERFAAGEPDRWDELEEAERERLYEAIFEQLVERSGAAPQFVHKLLPRPVQDYVLEAVAERRSRLAAVWEQSEEDPAQLRPRVTEEARRVLRAFLPKMPLERWDRLSPAQQGLRLAKLTSLVAERLELSLAEVTEALDVPMDALFHQERRQLEAKAQEPTTDEAKADEAPQEETPA